MKLMIDQQLHKPVIVITGCGSGLGYELARALSNREDYRVLITARAHKVEKLRQSFTENDRFKIRELDILNDQNIYNVIHDICNEWGRVDVVVNNAAVCYRGVIEHMDSEAELLQLRTNYLGPMSLVRAVLPIMREQRSGQIINISSVSGILAMPTMGSYSASKHALEGASEALWYEERPFGIRVNIVELGFVNSESFHNVVLSNKAKLSTLLKGPHSEYYLSMSPFIEKLMKLSVSPPRKIASKIIDVIEKQPTSLRIAATPDVWLFDFIRRIVPSKILNYLFWFMLPGSLSWGGRWRKSS